MPERGVHGATSQCRECEWTYKARCSPRHGDTHVSSALLQLTNQLKRFVRRDAAAHANHHSHQLFLVEGANRMLSMSLVPPIRAAIASNAPSETSSIGSKVSGSTTSMYSMRAEDSFCITCTIASRKLHASRIPRPTSS